MVAGTLRERATRDNSSNNLMTNHSVFARLVALAWALPIGPNLALVATEPDAAVQTLAPLQVTAGRTATPGVETAQRVSVVESETLERRSLATWTEALRGVPGAFLQSSGPGQGIVIVRGLKGSEVLHLVDGMRFNNSFFRNAPSQYLALLDPFHLERIELLRGSASTRYGSDAIGGVVQLFTPEPPLQDEHAQGGLRLRSRWDSAQLARTGRVEGHYGDARLGFAAGFSGFDYGARAVAGGERVVASAFSARGYDLALAWRPDAVQDWRLSGQHFTQPRTPRHHELVAGFADTPESTVAEFVPNGRRALQLRYRHAAPRGVDRLDVQLARQIILDNRRSQAFGSEVLEAEANRSRLDGLSLQVERAFGPRQLLRGGIDLYRDVIDSQRLRFEDGVLSTATARFPDGSEARSAGLYLVHEWTPLPAWRLDSGLRYTREQVQIASADRGIGVDLDEGAWTGTLGSVVTLGGGWQWTLSVGRGFRAPNVFDLGTLGNRPGNRFNTPNPDLAPETALSSDTGLVWQGERLRAEAVVFRLDYRDRIVSAPTGNTVEGREEVRSVNAAEARYYGVEAGLRWNLGASLGLQAAVNLTRGDERLAGTRQPADRVPPLNGSLGLDWQPHPRWRFDLQTVAADAQRRLAPGDLRDSRINPAGTPGWTRWDLGAEWQARGDLTLRLRGENLFDHAYREHGSGIDAVGRNAILMLDWTIRG